MNKCTAQSAEDLAALPDAATAPEVRRVVCAANKIYREGEFPVCYFFLGARHFDAIMKSAIDNTAIYFPRCNVDQGFIDEHGVFMTREEAWQVAAAAGQIRYRCGGDGEKLFSENLY